jgi:hypothetical protein
MAAKKAERRYFLIYCIKGLKDRLILNWPAAAFLSGVFYDNPMTRGSLLGNGSLAPTDISRAEFIRRIKLFLRQTEHK